jgi:regulator of cell morphogenesis and NO signaling
MENLRKLKISEVVASNIKSAHVFKKYGLDFCCGGGISIEKACTKHNIDIESLLSDLRSIDEKIAPSQNYNSWSLDFLIAHIENTHHVYVRDSLGLIEEYAAKVARVHGPGYQPIINIHMLFLTLKKELMAHMIKEELVLFPYINKLVQAEKSKSKSGPLGLGIIKTPISKMEHEHESAGNLLKEIAALSNNYTPPEWACNTFKALYSKLEEFEQDLHLHIHLENNILFPKAVLMEARQSAGV